MKLVIANKNYSRYYRWPHADGQMGGEPSKNQVTASSRSTLLGPTIKEMKLELQTTSFYSNARSEAFASYQDVIDMHDEAVAALHGRERVIESAAARGDLKARAGVNYKLLGEARMVEAPRWSVDARLRSVADGQAFGEALIAAVALLILFERTAAACPFCGGSGDKGDGILQTLVVAAVVGFGARAVWRALSRKRAGHHQDPPAEPSPRS